MGKDRMTDHMLQTVADEQFGVGSQSMVAEMARELLAARKALRAIRVILTAVPEPKRAKAPNGTITELRAYKTQKQREYRQRDREKS
jgi:hypothetical protein